MSDDPFDQLEPVPPEEDEPHPGGEGGPAADPEVLAACAALPLNDHGNGQRFAAHFGRDVLFVPRVGWFTWTGAVWEKDEDRLAVRRLAQRLGALIAAEVPYLPQSQAEQAAFARAEETERRIADLANMADRDEAAEEELQGLIARSKADTKARTRFSKRVATRLSFATSAGNATRLKALISEAEVLLARALEALDADPLAVNTASGLVRARVVDLRDEGGGLVAEMWCEPHDRDQLVTKLCPVAYAPEAACPGFEAFLARVQPDREMRAFLQRWLGLSLTASPVQRLAFFYGSGANGKSVLVDLCARVAGSYAATARIESLTGQNRRGGGDATPDLIPLMGARMVRTSEPDEGQRLQEGLIKELTGGEPLLVRALHSDFIEVRPVFKLTMSGNHKPEIRGTDDGIWRRVMLVPFDVQIPEDEREEGLAERLMAEEAPGILAWMLEGLRDVLEGGLAPPERVVAATRAYREESDPVGMFLSGCCVVTGDGSDTMRSADLGNAFAYYLLERGETAWKATTISRRLAAKAEQWRCPRTGARFVKGKASVSTYEGIRLTDVFGRRFRDAPKDAQGRPLGVAEMAVASSGAASPDPEGF